MARDLEAKRRRKREYMREYRLRRSEENPEHQREYQRRWREDRLSEARWWLGGKCLHCGSIEDLEFDHVDPSTKSFEIVTGYSSAARRFFTELEKCQLLCRPCHIDKTNDDRAKARERKLVSA